MAKLKGKQKEWLKRYIPAEILATTTALIGAWIAFSQTGSFVVAAASGWFGEGVGFYGYFITTELVSGGKKYAHKPFVKRIALAIASAGTNLLIEFLPAEILDNFFIRPFAMYESPRFIHPYPVGFLVGKFSADIIFYALAIVGYEAKKRWFRTTR